MNYILKDLMLNNLPKFFKKSKSTAISGRLTYLISKLLMILFYSSSYASMLLFYLLFSFLSFFVYPN
jgi:hypothetical protein